MAENGTTSETVGSVVAAAVWAAVSGAVFNAVYWPSRVRQVVAEDRMLSDAVRGSVNVYAHQIVTGVVGWAASPAAWDAADDAVYVAVDGAASDVVYGAVCVAVRDDASDPVLEDFLREVGDVA